MNVLTTINCKGPFSVYRAQIEMMCLLKNKGVNIKVIGFFSNQIKLFFDEIPKWAITQRFHDRYHYGEDTKYCHIAANTKYYHSGFECIKI